MNWLNVAYGFLFFSNLVFMVCAGFALYRIMAVTNQSRVDLLKAASLTMESGKQLKLAANRAVKEIERVNDTHLARESASSRALRELSFRVNNLADNLAAGAFGSGGHSMAEAEQQQVEDMRAKLQAELNAALSKNHVLQEQLEEVQLRIRDASNFNGEMRTEISEMQGVKQSLVDKLTQQAADLEEQLRLARERAKAAERQAEENAFQLDEIREKINAHQFSAPAASVESRGVDQSALIQDQQEQIDLLAAREKALLAKLDQMESEFQRQKTEKAFIEDRFLQLDSSQAPAAPSAET